MGLFDKIFKRPRPTPNGSELFKMFSGYTPIFTSWGGQLYESELVRSAIDAKARHISKLGVVVDGTAKPALRFKLKSAPNGFQTWSQFLYRLATILEVQNTAFVVPVFGDYDEITGIYPVLPSQCEFIESGGEVFLKVFFQNGNSAALFLNEVGILTKFQYDSDFFGEKNNALRSTMELINMQNQGIEQGIKSAATFRFMARVSNFTLGDDLKEERKKFNELNFKEEEGGGLLLFPNVYNDIKQIDSKPFVVDFEQMKLIQTNVYNYFGVNEDILQNKAFGDSWSAFYEGAVEPFAIQLSDVLSKMIFTITERNRGSRIFFSSSRLQYMSNRDKLNVSSQMLDRGIFSLNDVREIWNMPPVEGGDARIIRGEYYSVGEKLPDGNDTSKEEGVTDE